MKTVQSLISLLAVGLALVCGHAQTAPAAREFRFINAQSTTTFEKELNDNAAQGWRLERLPQGMEESSMGALLSRAGAGENGDKYEYKVLAAHRIPTLEKEFQALAAEGYEFRGLLSLYRVGDAFKDAFLGYGGETAVVVERPAEQKKRRFEYQLLSTKRESTLQKELDSVVSQGFHPLALIRSQDNSVAKAMLGIMAGPRESLTVILSRSAENPGAEMGLREYRFLGARKVSTMEKEMNQAAKDGYRFFNSSPGLLVLMARDPRTKEQKQQYEYKLLATIKAATMEKEMQEQGQKGFSYHATSSGMGGLTTVFERDLAATSGGQREYKLFTTLRDVTTQRELGEAVAGGYRLLDVTTVGKFVVVLDRPQQTAAK
jgi:hypothetical protein